MSLRTSDRVSPSNHSAKLPREPFLKSYRTGKYRQLKQSFFTLVPQSFNTISLARMHFTRALALISAAGIVTASPTPIELGSDDVILHGRGRFTVMKRSDLAELEAARNSAVPPPKPNTLDGSLLTYTGNAANVSNPNARFLGWDVQVSQIVKSAPTTINVASGFSITNSISVGVSSTLTLVKDFLSSWQSTQSQTFTAAVPEGKYGAFVSNPWTNRASGNVWTGTIEGEGSLEYYQGDSSESKTFDTMNWVDGVISLCTGDSFPLKRCLGEGTL
ncbi:hypothetical protein EK21DRAFT_102186 [Setomelanomma holmii]|uniref:Celp0028 effector like protein n=1 Tax=Setomelanomma holmii TaxID=210430 RepID=A0A9P4H4L7_9PLEO|nr:hypothetical protein EK21DRAFT_102186 [Setomelanomma holmii]